jgi:hypothetical protein
MKEITTTTEKYIICHNGAEVVHCILLKEGNKLSTGLEFVEEFTTKEEAKTRIADLTKDEEYFETNFSELN